jgi:LysM repeat protein
MDPERPEEGGPERPEPSAADSRAPDDDGLQELVAPLGAPSPESELGSEPLEPVEQTVEPAVEPAAATAMPEAMARPDDTSTSAGDPAWPDEPARPSGPASSAGDPAWPDEPAMPSEPPAAGQPSPWPDEPAAQPSEVTPWPDEPAAQLSELTPWPDEARAASRELPSEPDEPPARPSDSPAWRDTREWPRAAQPAAATYIREEEPVASPAFEPDEEDLGEVVHREPILRERGRRSDAANLRSFRAEPADVCPFLVAAGGGWRLATPSREHRCGAVSPAAALTPQKQVRLCLTDGHLHCATFIAAAAAREARLGSAAMPERVGRWALARTTPVVEEVGGFRTTLAGALADRRRWPAIPAMLLVVALATLGLSNLRSQGPVTALATPTPATTQPTTTASPAAPTATAAATVAPSPTATIAPTPAPTIAATPAASHQTYTVASGDTLFAIARKFGTTVAAIQELNGITDPGRLKIGQVLKIP